jgi:glycosyltransferase involved in cell wall biosynthesis
MNIIWCSWKDIKHPLSGGAEVVTDGLLKRLIQDGHEVILLTSRPRSASAEDVINGYRVVRNGSCFGVYQATRNYYKKNRLNDWADLVVEEINTIPFFTRFYVKKPHFLFFHQLAKEVWFYQMVWPLSRVGYWLEPRYLSLLTKESVLTVSKSTKADLVKHGFKEDKISLIREGNSIVPVTDLQMIKKYAKPTVLAFGAVRPMKRTIDIIRAFEHAKKQVPQLRLVVAGDMNGPYGEKALKLIRQSPYTEDISILGLVTNAKKAEVMQRAHVMTSASVKEGWGLVVTEANSQGTPVVAYDVDGVRDSVKNGVTGIITELSPQALGDGIVEILKDKKRYARMRQAAWRDSQQYTFDNSYKDFCAYIKRFLARKKLVG